ncbi:MAG: HEAT repeat domain-containing protein [Planctomycetota bacterium]
MRIQRFWAVLLTSALFGWLACAVSAAAAPLHADEIYLTDGTCIGGEVIGETDTDYIVRRGDSTFTIPKSEVLKIVKSPVPTAEYQKRLAALDKNDAKAAWALALWCRDNGLYKEYLDLAKRVIAIAPDDAAAHAALGQQKVGDQWLTEDEAKEAQGWHKIDGKWVSAEDYKVLQAKQMEEAATKKYFADMEKDLDNLGSSDGDKFDAAMKRATALGAEAHPVLYKFVETRLLPKDATLRIGAIKAFAAIGKTTQYSTGALLRAALRDSDERVAREAARAIKTLHDQRALQTLVDQVSDDSKPDCYKAAMALKEIDDNDIFQLMINAIPAEETQVAGGLTGMTQPGVVPPGVGGAQPGGGGMMGGGMTVTMVNNVEGGPLRALKWIAGKDLGNSKAVWQQWLDQKTGKSNRSAPVQGSELRKLP